MRRVRLSVAMSLDGYIAGPEGEFDWIVIDPEIDFHALMGVFDTLPVGRKTHEMTRNHGTAELPEMETYVFSKTLQQADCPGVVVSDDPEQMVSSLKAGSGKDLWLFGGGSQFRSFLDLGLLDSIEVAVIPVLLGGGIPLLPQPAEQAKLRLVNHRIYEETGTVSLEYALV